MKLKQKLTAIALGSLLLAGGGANAAFLQIVKGTAIGAAGLSDGTDPSDLGMAGGAALINGILRKRGSAGAALTADKLAKSKALQAILRGASGPLYRYAPALGRSVDEMGD